VALTTRHGAVARWTVRKWPPNRGVKQRRTKMPRQFRGNVPSIGQQRPSCHRPAAAQARSNRCENQPHWPARAASVSEDRQKPIEKIHMRIGKHQ